MDEYNERNAEHEFIKFYVLQHFQDHVQNIEKLNGRSMSHHYKVCCSKDIYTFRFLSNHFANINVCLMNQLSEKVICIQKVLDVVYLNNVEKVCIVSTWISGVTANKFINDNPMKIDRVAYSIANTMHMLHDIKIQTPTRDDFFVSEFKPHMEYVFLNNMKQIPHLVSYLEILKQNSDIKPFKEGVCHLDLHLGNIVIGKTLAAYLIDLENIGISDIWRDFSFATTFYESNLEKTLWRSVLNYYFENNIPDDFWMHNFIYSIVKMLHMCFFEIGKGNYAFASKISNDFFRIYNDLCDPIPIHFR